MALIMWMQCVLAVLQAVGSPYSFCICLAPAQAAGVLAAVGQTERSCRSQVAAQVTGHTQVTAMAPKKAVAAAKAPFAGKQTLNKMAMFEPKATYKTKTARTAMQPTAARAKAEQEAQVLT
jgi:hypothetical protein